MSRLAVLRCFDWSAVVAAGSSTSPCAVVYAQRVISRTQSAARFGVQVGMRRRQAQVLCPDIEIVAQQPSRDRSAFDSVVCAVSEIVPLVEVSQPGVIVFATRGPSRYMGGDELMATKMMTTLKTVITGDALIGVGVADSRLAAHIAAQVSATNSSAVVPYVVEPDRTGSWLAGQSVRVLSEFANINRDTVSLLERLGLHTLGNVCALDEAVLAGRFGEVGIELHRLANGDEAHSLAVVQPPPEHLCLTVFDDPVCDRSLVLNSVHALAVTFTQYFVDRGAVCVRLIIKFESASGDRSERLWYRPQGLTSRAIVESAKWQLESWLVADGLVLVQLVVDEVRTDTARQLKLWGGVSEVDETAAQAIDRLSELLGSSSVQIAKWQGGRDLLDSYQLVTAMHHSTTDQQNSDQYIESTKWAGALPTPSPSVVYPEPIQAQINDEYGKLLSVSARHELSGLPAVVVIGSVQHKVISWAGPWPVEERWWDSARQRRLVRLQLVVEKVDQLAETSQVLAILAILEHGEWTVAAIYG